MTLNGSQALALSIIVCLSVFSYIFRNYFKSLLFTPMEDLNWFDLVITWIIIWPFLIAYIPYQVVLWFNRWKKEKKQREENFEEWSKTNERTDNDKRL